jgi:hypothetical protein
MDGNARESVCILLASIGVDSWLIRAFVFSKNHEWTGIRSFIRVHSRFQKKSSRKNEIWSLINTDETSGYFAVGGTKLA